MGMYSRGNTDYSNLSVNLEEVESIECKTDNFNEAAMAMVVESHANLNNILEAVGISEFNYFEENGVEMVYESADIKGFFAKIKQWLVNLWQKIKGLFHKFVALFDSYNKSDKDFVNKYRKELLKINMKDFEFKGYKFDDAKITGINVGTIYGAAYAASGATKGPSQICTLSKEAADAELKKFDDISDINEKMRGGAAKAAGCSVSGPLDASEYAKELFMIFRDGEDSKTTLDNIKISDQLLYISTTKETVKTAEKSFKNFEKIIKEALKGYDKLEKELAKTIPSKDDKINSETQSYRLRLISTTSGLVRSSLDYAQIANGALLTALKDRNRQAKSICVAAMNYKPKNESVTFGGFSESGSFLDGVTIR